jgi:hypothetical protein
MKRVHLASNIAEQIVVVHSELVIRVLNVDHAGSPQYHTQSLTVQLTDESREIGELGGVGLEVVELGGPGTVDVDGTQWDPVVRVSLGQLQHVGLSRLAVVVPCP